MYVQYSSFRCKGIFYIIQIDNLHVPFFKSYLSSVGKVWFGLVWRPFFLNLELSPRFGSTLVQFRFAQGLNLNQTFDIIRSIQGYIIVFVS